MKEPKFKTQEAAVENDCRANLSGDTYCLPVRTFEKLTGSRK